MIDTMTSLLAATAPIIWLVLAISAYIKLGRYRTRRLLRCPESGGVAIVDIVEEERASGNRTLGRPRLRVQGCRLWPERGSCGRGCLIRSSQTWGSYGFDLASLRPLEEHELKRHNSLPH